MGVVAFKRIAESRDPKFAMKNKGWFEFFPGERYMIEALE